MPRLLSNREDVYERLMAGELLFSDLVLVARESEAEHERHAVHRERVTTNSATLASMLSESSSMREGSLDEVTVTLTLPPQARLAPSTYFATGCGGRTAVTFRTLLPCVQSISSVSGASRSTSAPIRSSAR